MTEGTNAGPLDEVPVERISRYLDERDVAHEVVEHDETFTAMAEARAAGVAAGAGATSVRPRVRNRGHEHLVSPHALPGTSPRDRLQCHRDV